MLQRNQMQVKKETIFKKKAKKISGILSNNSATRRQGKSKYNAIFEFKFNNLEMVFTSVSGHLMDMDFEDKFRSWSSCDPIQLFDAPITKFVPKNSELIAETLKIESKRCQQLILWLDGDREGENISL
jgi:DNA topoisomerase III